MRQKKGDFFQLRNQRMLMKKLMLPILLFFALVGTVQGQTLKAWERAGDKALIKEDYYSAYRYFEIAIEYDSSKIDNWYKLAEAARQFDAYNKAAEAYQYVIDSERRGSYPLAAYWHAVTRQKLGQYTAAKALYESFLDAVHKNIDEKYKESAIKGIEDCEWALEQITGANDTLRILNLGEHINTPYSEFGPFLLADTFYYSSFQFVYQKDSVVPPRTHIKILQSVDNEKGKILPGGFNLNDRHVAHSAFNTDYSSFYYTICDYIGGSKDIRCTLYSRYRLADGSWTEPQKLSINQDGFTHTQPNVGMDTESGKEYLYFTSDRPGGNGQLDLWRSEIDSVGQLTEPENLIDLNTPGNDVTPFFHTLTQTLYFSSDGYQTLGGYDIYQAKKKRNSWEMPNNMGIPINSSYNDLYYSLFSYGSQVYLSSNRPDSSAIFWDEDREACCNDIYGYQQPPMLDFLATTFNLVDSTTLAGATLKIYEITPDGNKLIDSLTNRLGNDFTYPLLPSKKYYLEAEREGFALAFDSVDLSPNLPELSPKIERKFYLEPKLFLEALTFRQVDSVALTGSSVALYEWLDGKEQLVDSLTNLANNDFLFPLEPGKKYIIKGTHENFFPVSDTLDLSLPDAPLYGKIQRKLYFESPEPLLLEVLTFNGQDSSAMAGAWVYLYEIVDGEEKLIDSLFNAGSNDFLFPLEPGKDYLVRGMVEGFDFAEKRVDLKQPGSPQAGKIQRKLYFETGDPELYGRPYEPLYLEVLTYRKLDSLALTESTVALYELVDGEHRLIDSLTNYQNNDFLFPLEPGKQYVVQGMRDGFIPVEEPVDLTQPGLPQSGNIQKKLYLDRPGPFQLEALTFRRLDSLALTGGTVALYEIQDGKEVLLDSLFKEGDNDFLFPLERNKLYVIKGMREGFYPVTDTVDTRLPEYAQVDKVEKELFLAPPLRVEALTFRQMDSLALNGGTVAIFDVTEGEEVLLDSLVNPVGNDFTFELDPNRQYVIKALRDGFFPTVDSLHIGTPKPDEPTIIRKDLFLTPPVRIEALTFREMDSLALPGSQLYVYEVSGIEERLVDSLTNPSGNRFVLEKLDPRKQYVIKAWREGFYPTVDTLNMQPGRDIEKMLYLSPPQLKALTYNREDLLALPGSSIAIYDITGGEERLVDSLVNKGDNDFVLDLDPGRNYILRAYHADFHPLVDTLRLPPAKLNAAPFLDRELKLIPKVVLDVETFRQNDSLALFGSTVYLYDVTGETPILLDSLTADQEENDFFFILQPDKKYIIGALKDGYYPVSDTLDLTRPGMPNIGPLKRDLYLGRPSLDASLEVLTFDEETKEPLSGVLLKLLRITENGVDTIDKQINEITNDFLFEISANGGEFIIIGEKEGYETSMDTLSVSPEDLELGGGKKTYNVYLNRVSMDNMLPLALYFDNDRPDRRTWRTTTNTDYLPTNEAYYARKDDFIQGFTEDLSETEKYLTVRRFDIFFEREVKEARNELLKFTRQIHDHLKDGRTVKMRLKGFCSPRGASRYNQMLSSRRIDCVKNHFKRYEGGVLMQYIRSGQLAFLEESYGESQADASKISDKFDDLKNSVYSLLASAERRVQIDEVIIE